MAHEIESEPGEDGWSVLAVVVLVVATWALLFVGLVSFGPGSMPFASLVLFASGIGFVVAPFVPLVPRSRLTAAAAMGVGALAVAAASVAFTPPGAAPVRAELEGAGEAFASLTNVTVSAGQSGAPWEAPVASGSGEVDDGGRLPLETAVDGLEAQGWSVTVLRAEADGLTSWLASERGSLSWDLSARRGRYELRAAFSESQVLARLAWHPILGTYDPFTSRGFSAFFVWLGTVAAFTVGAALVAMVGIVLGMASVGLAGVVVTRAVRDRRP